MLQRLQSNTLEQRKYRKYKRLKLSKTIVLNPGNACVLINISRDGLLFKSLRGVVWPAKWLLDIITIKSEFDIQHCPVEFVWMKTDEELIGSSMMVENVGVKFGDLDQSQRTKLDYLLSHF